MERCTESIVMAAVSAKFLNLDRTETTKTIIGAGSTGIVVRDGHHAVKIPRLSVDNDDSDGRLPPEHGNYDPRCDLIEAFKNEKEGYARLGDHSGIVSCLNGSTNEATIRMPLMVRGDLRHYLEKEKPNRVTQLRWMLDMGKTMAYIHERRVIIADVRLDNILLDDELNTKFTDFSEVSLLPLDSDLDEPDDLGFSVLSVIGQFGAMMFEMVTGLRCRFDIMADWAHSQHSTWPRRDTLPQTQGIWLGEIIEKCWTCGFARSEDLINQLDGSIKSET